VLGFLRRALVAFGALVAAYLIVRLVGGTLLPGVILGARGGSELSWPALAQVVLGAFVYREIVRRSRLSSSRG